MVETLLLKDSILLSYLFYVKVETKINHYLEISSSACISESLKYSNKKTGLP